jgi:hypothetical protein
MLRHTTKGVEMSNRIRIQTITGMWYDSNLENFDVSHETGWVTCDVGDGTWDISVNVKHIVVIRNV